MYSLQRSCLLLLFLTIPLFVTAQTLSTSPLPIVIIDTHGQSIVDEPKITADLKIIDNGPGKRNAVTDAPNVYNGKMGIEIRGSSSQSFPKKQYGFETRDSLGNSIDVSLLGFPEESDWILSAQYNDKTLMRDVFTYALWNAAGRYASRTKYCEVVINGQYQGVYMLFEKLKRDKNRVNISKIDTSAVFGDPLTGGYIIKIDKLDGAGNDGWYSPFLPRTGSPYKILYQYHYPKPEDINAQQKNYIKNFVTGFETVLASADYADTVNGYTKYLDERSLTDYILLTELTKNVDGYRLSLFLSKDKDSKDPKMYAGPVWDFNIALGNADYYDGAKTQGWQISYFGSNTAFFNDGFQPPFWWTRIFLDLQFRGRLQQRWKELRKGPWSLVRMVTFIDSVASHISEPQQRNFQRWPVLNTYVWPNPYIGGSYANEVNYLKQWLTLRIDWMDQQLAGGSLPVPGTTAPSDGSWALEQNYPNPFNPSTTIAFRTAHRSRVRLELFDMLGRSVRTIVDAEMDAGAHEVRFDGSSLPSGAYIYRLSTNGFSSVRQCLLMK